MTKFKLEDIRHDFYKNDLIRDLIIEFLYEKSINARGINQRRCAISPIARCIKNRGFSEQLVAHNLGYLIDAGWVKGESESTTLHSGFGGMRSKPIKIKTNYYLITDKGINQFEQESKYQKKVIAGINITNIGGITVVGDNNYVQTNSKELYQVLSEIKTSILVTNEVNDKTKLEIKSDIETIQAQLAKENPAKDIIRLSWSSLGILATVDGVISLYQKAESLVQKLL